MIVQIENKIKSVKIYSPCVRSDFQTEARKFCNTFFIDPKNPFWSKFQTPKNPSDLPNSKICEWGLCGQLWYPLEYRITQSNYPTVPRAGLDTRMCLTCDHVHTRFFYRPLSQSCAERAILHGSEAKGL